MLIKYCKTNNNKKPEVSLRVRLHGWWAGRPDALGSGHREGLSMGETSDPSPEGQRGNPVRTGDGGGGGGCPREQKAKVLGARKEAQKDWGVVRS